MTASASMPSAPVPTLPPSASVGMVCGQGASTANSRFAAHPVRNRDFHGAHVGEAEPLHFAQCPGDGRLVAGRAGGSRSDLGGQRFD